MKKIARLGEAKEKLLRRNASRGVDVQLLALGLPLIECRDHIRIEPEKSRKIKLVSTTTYASTSG